MGIWREGGLSKTWQALALNVLEELPIFTANQSRPVLLPPALLTMASPHTIPQYTICILRTSLNYVATLSTSYECGVMEISHFLRTSILHL